MLSAIRKRMHLTPSGVIATLALVFAMTGGAYAANKYLITSTKQISPKVLKALKGAKGANGAAGLAGVAGVQGPAGTAGAGGKEGSPGKAGEKGEKGTTGEKGEKGTTGEKGTAGEEGIEGSPWTASGTLPKGKTETGEWSYSNENKEGTPILASVSFPIPLAAELAASHVHFINGSGKEVHEGIGVAPTECGSPVGTAAEPKASPGNLCVYETYHQGINPEFAVIGSKSGTTSGEQNAGRAGAAVLLIPNEKQEPREGFGSFAVTAP
jgi:Collagen triple helix repeat (20 copies)